MRKAEITVEVVACLIGEQFPQWAGLEICPVDLDGWDNATFRLGSEMSVRLPSHPRYVPQIDKEHRWLPVLARRLPLPIPRPIARGTPGCGFPSAWSIYGWLPGEPAATVGVRAHERLAADLGAFLCALQAVDAGGGPAPGLHSSHRGGPVSVWDGQVRSTLSQLTAPVDAVGALEVWEAALAAGPVGSGVWVHGDVTGSNLLLRNDRLCGVVDFGCAAVGDPACDLTPAWTMFDGPSREMFKRVLALDDATWARARGWALWKAAVAIPGRSVGDPDRSGARFGWRWSAQDVISQVIADHRAGRRG